MGKARNAARATGTVGRGAAVAAMVTVLVVTTATTWGRPIAAFVEPTDGIAAVIVVEDHALPHDDESRRPVRLPVLMPEPATTGLLGLGALLLLRRRGR